MPRITVSNEVMKTSVQINMRANGLISYWTRQRVRRKLLGKNFQAPPGFPEPGPLGEYGPQHPPERPGWSYTFVEIDGGNVRAVPAPIAVEAANG